MDRSRRIAMKHNAGSILISRESADKSADGFWRVRISLSSKKGKNRKLHPAGEFRSDAHSDSQFSWNFSSVRGQAIACSSMMISRRCRPDHRMTWRACYPVNTRSSLNFSENCQKSDN
jgi:hypothetical protein